MKAWPDGNAEQEGQLVNPTVAEGRPVPADLNQDVASLKPAALEIDIDGLTQEQMAYLPFWKEGA